MVEPLLRVNGASKRYPGGIEALRKAQLTIAPGEFVCLIGASGCGKSTLLRMIGGFETPTEGEIIMRGKPVTGPGPRVRYQRDPAPAGLCHPPKAFSCSEAPA